MRSKIKLQYIVLLLLAVASAALWYSSFKKGLEIKKERERLAYIMGVSLDTYPYLPDDYFPKVLVQGTTLDDVHKIVVGYRKVFHMSTELTHYEVYYYFSADENKSDRIAIAYDQEFLITKIEQEDENSRTLSTDGWDEGPLIK